MTCSMSRLTSRAAAWCRRSSACLSRRKGWRYSHTLTPARSCPRMDSGEPRYWIHELIQTFIPHIKIFMRLNESIFEWILCDRHINIAISRLIEPHRSLILHGNKNCFFICCQTLHLVSSFYERKVLSMKGKVKANFQKSDRLEQKDEHTQISTKID